VLANVHVFHWRGQPRTRLPLADGETLWREVVKTIAKTGRDHALLLEFVADDEPRRLLEDAATLYSLLLRYS